MRKLFAGSLVFAVAGWMAAYSQTNAVIYEGARLIIGDASAPIENGAFVVRNGRITAIGPKGSV
jgi:imidazolonepropionase-like amidohydrolase